MINLFKNLFGGKDNLEKIFQDNPHTTLYKNALLEFILTILKQVDERKSDLFEILDIDIIKKEMQIILNNNLLILNEEIKELDIDDNTISKIKNHVIQEVVYNGNITNIFKFIIFYSVLSSFGNEINSNSNNRVVIDGNKLGEILIFSIFEDYELFLNLSNQAYFKYEQAIKNAVLNNIDSKQIVLDYSFENFIYFLFIYIKEKLNLKDDFLKDNFIKSINKVVIYLSSVNKLNESIEYILFGLIRGIGFNGGLNIIPSFHLIEIAQNRRDYLDNDYLFTADFILNKNEKIVYDKGVDLRKLKNENQYTGLYYGITGSIRIVKGLNFRIGKIVIPKQKVETLETIDKGNIYITNQRIVFKGKRKSFTINYSELFAIELSEYGMLLFKKSNENPYIIGMREGDYLVFSELISDFLV